MIVTTQLESLSSDMDVAKVLNLLKKACWSFQKGNGGDFDELMSEASLAYVQARNGFDPSKGAKFSSWLYQIVRGRLMDWKRKQYSKRIPLSEDDPNTVSVNQKMSLIDAIRQECSPDSGVVVQLILNPPIDVILTARQWRSEKSPISLRIAVEQHLRELGWAVSRVWQAFGEIQEALS